MLPEKKLPADLTDEEVLKEFVKRFNCDGAILIYHDQEREFGFGRWRNSVGKKWVNNLFENLQKDLTLLSNKNRIDSIKIHP